MGTLRKTTAELERKGAFDKNPQRARARASEPVVKTALGPPPASFTNPHSPSARDLLEAWNELLDETKEVLITSADRGHFEMTARLRVRCRRPGATTGDFAQLNKYQSQLGLNPASRSLVNGNGVKTTTEEEDEWTAAAAGSDGLPVPVQ
jgi:hypothetical protein